MADGLLTNPLPWVPAIPRSATTMADELDDELLDGETKEQSQRIKQLSSKAREALEKATAESEAKLKVQKDFEAYKKETEFKISFTDLSAKYPLAKEHAEEIKQKVLSGYSVEDATIAILAKVGKLKTADDIAKETARSGATGGSASTVTQPNAQKSVSEMTQAERRAALVEAEARGDIFIDGGGIRVK